MPLSKDELLVIASGIKVGTRISGINPGKFYRFSGLERYDGRGRYKHLAGQTILILYSSDRKRSEIRLFIDPLLLLCNSKTEDLAYGTLPKSFITEFIDAEFRPVYPKLFEFVSHYK